MFKQMFNRKTSKLDVFMAGVAAVVATWKAVDTYKEFKQDQAEEASK